MFTIKANRSTVHIAGITERTSSTGAERGGVVGYYAESACAGLTRSGHRMETLGSFDDIEEALTAAEHATYSISGRKVCKNCLDAAEALTVEMAEAANPYTPTPEEETVATTNTESLARITDLDARIEVMQDRLATAVDYATAFRSSDEPDQVEACEKAIRFANMLSQAILATAVRPTR